MAKVAVPIIKLQYANDDAYSNQIMDIFEEEQAVIPEEIFTYTARVSLDLYTTDIDNHDDEKRARIVARLRSEMVPNILSAEDVERLIALLDAHDWDVSFFVDTY